MNILFQLLFALATLTSPRAFLRYSGIIYVSIWTLFIWMSPRLPFHHPFSAFYECCIKKGEIGYFSVPTIYKSHFNSLILFFDCLLLKLVLLKLFRSHFSSGCFPNSHNSIPCRALWSVNIIAWPFVLYHKNILT